MKFSKKIKTLNMLIGSIQNTMSIKNDYKNSHTVTGQMAQ